MHCHIVHHILHNILVQTLSRPVHYAQTSYGMPTKENIISHKKSYSNVQAIPITSVDRDSTSVHQWNCCSLLKFLVERAFWLMIHITSSFPQREVEPLPTNLYVM